MTKLVTLFKKEPALIIGSLVTLVEGLAIPNAGKVVAILTFVGAIITRQTVFSPSTVESMSNG